MTERYICGTNDKRLKTVFLLPLEIISQAFIMKLGPEIVSPTISILNQVQSVAQNIKCLNARLPKGCENTWQYTC